MCVIMIAESVRPTEKMIEDAFRANDDGAGMAWREDKDGGGREVVWEKGLDLQEVKDLCLSTPLPFVVHFRVASVGGIRPSLTHPFPIEENAPLALVGRTDGEVLFHNGHWREWADKAQQAAILTRTPIPTGRWSDSRAMAWLCSIYGTGFMEFLPEQRGVAFGPNTLDVFTGPGWVKVNEVWCSNDFFNPRSTGAYHQPQQTSYISAYCKYGQCNSKTLDEKGYCAMHKDGIKRLAGELGPKVNTGTGGSLPVTPFPLPAGQIISLELAERLHKEKRISKQTLKSIRKGYAKLKNGGKSAEKGRNTLKNLSICLISSGLVH